MVATMTRREDNIAEESMLVITTCIPVCVLLFVISLLSPTCWLWRRDNNEETGRGTYRRHYAVILAISRLHFHHASQRYIIMWTGSLLEYNMLAIHEAVLQHYPV